MIPAGYGISAARWNLGAAMVYMGAVRLATQQLGWLVCPVDGLVYQHAGIRIFGADIARRCFTYRRQLVLLAWNHLLCAAVLPGIRVEALAPTSFFSKPGAGRGAGQAQLATGARSSGSMQGRSTADHRAHIPEAAGATPAPAPTFAPSAIQGITPQSGAAGRDAGGALVAL